MIPLLVLDAALPPSRRSPPTKVPLAAVLAFLLLVELATLSRSGLLLGLAAGLLVLAIPIGTGSRPRSSAAARRRRGRPRSSSPPAGTSSSRFSARGSTPTSANGTSTRFDVYGFIPDVLSSNPFFGLGLNNFSVYYEFVTGRTNFGAHSFYVATLVETGLVGTALFAAFLVYLFRRLGRLRAIGQALGSPRSGARLGMTAALAVGTIAANVLPDDVLLLLLRLRAARARGADRLFASADVRSSS